MPDGAPCSAAVVDSVPKLGACFDWQRIARHFLTSRALDHVEETRLWPARKIPYQFSARGHELGQVLLGCLLTGAHDAASGYYRSRPLLLTLGLSPADALAGGMAKAGSVSEGRDIGAVYNLPRSNGPTVLPMAGGVGTQYTTTVGWARALIYYRDTLRDVSYGGSIAVALGGDGSVATNGFWSALTLATTLSLPMMFFIEDNAYGLSVPAEKQTPGGNIAANLASFENLRIFDSGDSPECRIGTDPVATARAVAEAAAFVRSGAGPALIRLTMPRLSGHSGQDSQAYKPTELLARERARDPLVNLKSYLIPARISESEWQRLEKEVERDVEAALDDAQSRHDPDPATIFDFAFVREVAVAASSPLVAGPRINLVEAIRRTLKSELRANPKLLVFGEDVGAKGGVHAATQDLQKAFGDSRVFDTSLSEEGIVGSAVGLALAGLRPVAEIQFRKYIDPGTEQLNDCGTIRWRTANRFSAPIVVRVAGGFAKCGDPWHSVSAESVFAHSVGWQVVMPSNAADAVGLLRTAMRSANPTIFFEHRALLDAADARRPYPGDDYLVPLGRARMVQEGADLTVVTWGAMVDRCFVAAERSAVSVEILDLRTIVPWDRAAVLQSVSKTARCLVVHEDTLTVGFGAEIAATVAREAFYHLDVPVERMAVADVPLPYNVGLMEAVLPSVDGICNRIQAMVA